MGFRKTTYKQEGSFAQKKKNCCYGYGINKNDPVVKPWKQNLTVGASVATTKGFALNHDKTFHFFSSVLSTIAE